MRYVIAVVALAEVALLSLFADMRRDPGLWQTLLCAVGAAAALYLYADLRTARRQTGAWFGGLLKVVLAAFNCALMIHLVLLVLPGGIGRSAGWAANALIGAIAASLAYARYPAVPGPMAS